MKDTKQEQERAREFNFIYLEALNPEYEEDILIEMKGGKS